jgi:hypothetical protein
MANERALEGKTGEGRDRLKPQTEADRPVHGDKLQDPKSAASEKKDLPKRSHDMDQPGMDPDEEN